MDLSSPSSPTLQILISNVALRIIVALGFGYQPLFHQASLHSLALFCKKELQYYNTDGKVCGISVVEFVKEHKNVRRFFRQFLRNYIL